MVRTAAAIVVALAALTGCNSYDCKLMGCTSGLYIVSDLTDGATHGSIHACVGTTCIDQPFSGFAQVLLPALRTAGTHSASITITGLSAEHPTITFDGPVAFIRSQPNGAGCPPTCSGGSIRLTDAGTLVAVTGASLSSQP